MTAPPRIAAANLRAALQGALHAGVSPGSLLAAVGLDAGAIDDADALVPLETAQAFWREAAHRAGDDHFGLHVGAAIEPSQLGTFGYVLITSTTLGEALDRAIRYERLLASGFATRVERRAGVAWVLHEAERPDVACERHPMEYVLSLILAISRALVAGGGGVVPPVRPLEVRFRHAPPADTGEARRVFGAPVRYAAPENALLFPTDVLALPVRGANAGVAAAITAHVDALLAAREARDAGDAPAPTAARVRRHLAGALRGGEPTLASVARELAMSERTLQRRLVAEGVRYQALLDELRRDLALDYARDPALSLGEAALLTGFSEPSAFHRAFRRWTGQSPSAYRARAARGAASPASEYHSPDPRSARPRARTSRP